MINIPELITIPAGSFIMGTGADDRFANSTERPAHEVVISQPFAAGRFPVTEAQWFGFKGEGSVSPLPVVHVSWFDAQQYVSWLQEQTNLPFRLLTENEWEYCCRAGSTTIFATGDDLAPTQANYLYDELGFKIGPGSRSPAGAYPVNAFGLEDMHGNVCEWVADAWCPSYSEPSIETTRVIRGGAWDYMPRLLRSAWRDSAAPDVKRDNLGFRIACNL